MYSNLHTSTGACQIEALSLHGATPNTVTVSHLPEFFRLATTMHFQKRVALVTATGRHLYYTHGEHARVLCLKHQAVAITDKLIQLSSGQSLGSIRAEHRPKQLDGPQRRTYHGATVPAQHNRLTWAPRYDKTESGLPGSLRHIGFSHSC